MKTLLSRVAAVVMTASIAFTLNGCATESDGYSGYGGYNTGRNIVTRDVYVGKDYTDYTRYDTYPSISGGTFYSYGGRYYGGGYGNN